MLRKLNKIGTLGLIIALLAPNFLHAKSYAVSQYYVKCAATVSPTDVTPASSTNFDINITNTGTEDLQWVDLTVPAGFAYIGNSIPGWNTQDHSDNSGTTATGGDLPPGQSADFYMMAATDTVDAPSSSWQISGSTNPSGSGYSLCDGNPQTSISGTPPNYSDYGVSNVAVSNISTTSATITWQTNSPMDALVYYGPDSNYGNNTPYSSTQNTNQSVTLTGLDPDTAYHYQVVDADNQGNFAYSADNTLLTASIPPPAGNIGGTNQTTTTTTTNPASSTTPTTHSVIVNKGSGDKTPPQLTINTAINGSYKTAPTISGTASDNVAVAKIEYSTDDGQNWLPADTITNAGQPNLTYSFTPLLPQDGNYLLKVRATDSSGNTTTTSPLTLVIDHLPPIVGGNIFSVGPQVVSPSSDGTINTQVGVDLKVTLSSIGGPTNISINASTNAETKSGVKTYNQNFNLTPIENNELWSGVVSFTRTGLYTLTVNAVDGAGNKTSRVINNVYVSGASQTISKVTNKPIQSSVTVYYFEPESQSWVIWDGNAFGQSNPLKTDKNGKFSIFLPTGKYYLQASAKGYKTLVSDIFTNTQPSSISTTLKLDPSSSLHIGNHHFSLPTLSTQPIDITNKNQINSYQSSLIGKRAPDFSLSDTNQKTIQTVNLLGKPTLLSFDSVWSPLTADQINILSKLQSNPNLNIIPIALQENSQLVKAYTGIANVNLNWLTDPNSTLSNSYNVQSLPMNYFIDRNGIVRQMYIGVLSEQQIEEKLSNL